MEVHFGKQTEEGYPKPEKDGAPYRRNRESADGGDEEEDGGRSRETSNDNCVDLERQVNGQVMFPWEIA